MDAPATFVPGQGVTAEQQALVKRSLDIGATYFRALGRDLPPTTVYLDDDLEGIVQVYAATRENTSVEHARTVWAGNVGDADYRKLYVFFGSAPWAGWGEAERLKLVVHEAFHTLQYELGGRGVLNAGPDAISRAGPKWLMEGTAEYSAYKAVAAVGATSYANIRGQWVRRTKVTPNTLQSHETQNGFRAGGEGYQIAPLAIDFLLGSGSGTPMVAYYEAIGRGTPWQEAFVAAFGRSIDVFYEQFEAYRRTL